MHINSRAHRHTSTNISAILSVLYTCACTHARHSAGKCNNTFNKHKAAALAIFCSLLFLILIVYLLTYLLTYSCITTDLKFDQFTGYNLTNTACVQIILWLLSSWTDSSEMFPDIATFHDPFPLEASVVV